VCYWYNLETRSSLFRESFIIQNRIVGNVRILGIAVEEEKMWENCAPKSIDRMEEEWTQGDQKLLQRLVQHKVVCESDLIKWFHQFVLQSTVENNNNNNQTGLTEQLKARLVQYKEKLQLLGLSLNSIWVQEKNTSYWSIVNARDDRIAQKVCKYSDTDILVFKTMVDYLLQEKNSPTELIDKRELLSSLDSLKEKRPKPMEVDSALNKLSKDQWIWLQNDQSHRVYIQLSPRTILELPHVFDAYLSSTWSER